MKKIQLVVNGKYNLKAIMKMAHAYLKAGSLNIASALRKVWDFAQDAMSSFRQESWIQSNISLTGQQMKDMKFKLD